MKRDTREIDSIVIHCSDTPAGRDVTAAEIDRWHRQRGFEKIGYHYVVRLDGSYERGRADDEVGAHCKQKRMNYRSIGICYVGGRGKDGSFADTRTEAQKKTILTLIRTLRGRYGNLRVYGHRDFAPKACPCFDAQGEYN